MKKSIILAWLGLAVSVAPAFGVGYIMLDNYDTYGPDVTYSWPVSIENQGLQPGGWGGSWTVGFYYAMGDVTSFVPPFPLWDDPSYWGGGFMLATGPGSTATVYDSAYDTPGEFIAYSPFQVDGNPGDTITVVMVAYDLASYAASAPTFPYDDDFPWGFGARGRSAAFTMTLGGIDSAFPNMVGDFMPGFSVYLLIPEPGVLVLSSLGVAVLMVTAARRGHRITSGVTHR